MAEPLESTTTTTTAAATFADDFLADFEPGLSPAEVEGEEEEELEWMKSFPPLETFVAPPPTPTPPAEAAAPAAARSPVSVLTLAPPMNLPARARSKIRRRKRRVFYNVPVAAEISVPVLPVTVPKEKGNRKCQHCGSETTPQWRAGPKGPKTLCNACGVRFKSGRLVPEYRPANSPTFSAALHSNSHRRIMEMRRRSTGRGRPRLVIL